MWGAVTVDAGGSDDSRPLPFEWNSRALQDDCSN